MMILLLLLLDFASFCVKSRSNLQNCHNLKDEVLKSPLLFFVVFLTSSTNIRIPLKGYILGCVLHLLCEPYVWPDNKAPLALNINSNIMANIYGLKAWGLFPKKVGILLKCKLIVAKISHTKGQNMYHCPHQQKKNKMFFGSSSFALL